MAGNYEIEIFSQNSIYNKSINTSNYDRKLKVYFSIPQEGVNEDTGLLLFIAGFDGQSSSNVYKKMRDKFSDEYNLVTIQCDYFGYEFMQSTKKVFPPIIDKAKLKKIFSFEDFTETYKNGQLDITTFLKLGSKYNINVTFKEDLSKENIDNFNDMGILQTIDNLVALLNVISILSNNNYHFNSKKIIVYGHSHGAYLSYLCNAFAPDLFSFIIDNSAWLVPYYLVGKDRHIFSKNGNLTIAVVFDYLAKKIIDDTEILNLDFLYSKFKNNCSIISYHGTTDNLISCHDKSLFCSKVNKCIYNEISKEKVDNNIFKSTNHGLDADFLKLFHFTMNNFNIKFDKAPYFDLQEEVIFETSKHKYIINYKNILPQVHIL